ncbi:hypothetical protein JOD20_004439 [Herpetosiphon giganteus]|nr:hypothetical protein [Herpetosiphon giganteus]
MMAGAIGKYKHHHNNLCNLWLNHSSCNSWLNHSSCLFAIFAVSSFVPFVPFVDQKCILLAPNPPI